MDDENELIDFQRIEVPAYIQEYNAVLEEARNDIIQAFRLPVYMWAVNTGLPVHWHTFEASAAEARDGDG